MVGILAAGCRAAEQPLPLTEFLSQCDSFKGKTVQVAGYLGDCRGYDCQLFTGKPGSDRFVAVRSGGVERSAITIGGGQAFGNKAAPFQQSYVAITGRVADSNCNGRESTDRSPRLHPSNIRASTVSEAAPAKLVVRNS